MSIEQNTREIKFRYIFRDKYDHSNVRIVHISMDELELIIATSSDQDIPEINKSRKYFDNRLIWEAIGRDLYTGLKDKNGVEIWESDILRNTQERSLVLVRWELTGARWSFDEYGGFDDGVGRGNWDLNMGFAKQSEVIGNIYENSDLLERNA